jgi:hypothetical protein
MSHHYFKISFINHHITADFRDALTTGLASQRTIEILRGSAVFRPFIETLEGTRKLKALWLVINLDGSHPLHQDKFGRGANYRNLISFGGGNKRMWFYCNRTGSMCGISIPHNAFVTLNKFGGGVVGDISHCVVGAANTYLVAFETV